MKKALSSYPCLIKDLGLIEYSTAYHLQQQAVKDVLSNGKNVLFLCEHPPVFTLGRLATEDNILAASNEIQEKGATVVRIDRGGEITFHGPGQLVIYPIFDLNYFGKDLRVFMGKLEQVAIDLLQHFGIVADRIKDRRGVWVGNQKIASIGIGVRKWISFHGMAVNINTDLQFFSMIKPCGLDVEMTSVGKITSQRVDFKEAKEKTAELFCRHFALDLV